MKQFTRGLLLAALVSSPGAASHAADKNGAFAIKGIGFTRCGDYVKAVKEKDTERAARYVGWISGFISAANAHISETYDLAPWQNVRTLSSMMMAYCDRNSDTRFAKAAQDLRKALYKDRIEERTTLMPLEHEGNKAVIYKETLRRLQAKLAELGMLTGDVNGTFDEATRSAIRNFQTENELPGNGIPDQRTLHLLFRKPPQG